MLILGLDPGKTTGAAIFSGPDMIDAFVIPNGFEGFKSWWPGQKRFDLIVAERYVPLEGFRGKDQTYSLLVQGALGMVADNVRLQTRSDKATLFNQKKSGDEGQRERWDWLESKGLKFPSVHSMDAATHVLVNRKRAKDMAFWKRYWA